MKKATPLSALLTVLVGVPAFGQIGQNHPELCGKANASVLLPPNVSATIDESTGQGDLFVGPGKSASKIALPGVVNEIEEVCPVSGNTMVVFSRAAELSEVFIVDSKRAVLLDSIWGFAPALSPDQRWLVFRKFYPRRTELPVSEEYLLYDLAKTPIQNRPPGIELDDYADVGTVVFPIGQNNTLTDNIGVPEDQQHSAASESFW